MKAVLLIGGMATRLLPLSKTLAKSLMPICDREILHYQISQLARAGISQIVLAAGHLVDQLAVYVQQYSGGLEFRISLEEQPLGTAGAIANAKELLEGDSAVVLNADILSSVDIGAVVELHQKSGRAATLVGYKVEDPSRFGLLEADGESLTGFREKPDQVLGEGPHYINAGVYVLSPEAISSIPDGRVVSIERETFPQLLEQHGSLAHYAFDGLWADIGTFESYFSATFKLLARRYSLGDDQVWGQRDDCAVFKDLVYINKSAQLGPGTDLFHRVVVMAGSATGGDNRLQNCIIMPGASIGKGTRLNDCVIGPGCKVGEGLELNNQVILDGEANQPFYPEAVEAG